LKQGHQILFIGLRHDPLEKVSAIADCLEKQFTPHDLCEETRSWRLEDRVETVREALNSNPRKSKAMWSPDANKHATIKQGLWFWCYH